MATDQTSAAFHELLAKMRELESKLDGLDDASRLEGYKWIFSVTQVAFDSYVWADTRRPRFVDIVGPYKKWGGDNPDAFYQYAPIDPTRAYRVSGTKGDAVYLSLTIYGGPDDGRWSDRIVGTVNDREITFDANGDFEFVMSPEPEDGPAILLTPDAVAAVTRDYMPAPDTGTRTQWHIEAIDPPRHTEPTDDDLARRFRAAMTFIDGQAQICPLPEGEPNTMDDPYPVPAQTFGWAAGDAAYAMGRYELTDGQSLELKGTSPACAFWNMVLWNPFLHTYDWAYDRVSINGEQATYEADGSWTIVVSPSASDHPNHVSTQGHHKGFIWFRWFLPDHTPDPIRFRVIEA